MERAAIPPDFSSLQYCESLLKIDEMALDKEIQQQPELYWQVSKQAALSLSHRDVLEAEVKRVESALSLDIRKHVSKDDKITENAIKALIQTNKQYLDAMDMYFTAKQEADLWEGLLKSFSNRGYALNKLCEMWLANYSQQNAVKHGTREEVSEAQYIANRRILFEAREAKKREQTE